MSKVLVSIDSYSRTATFLNDGGEYVTEPANIARRAELNETYKEYFMENRLGRDYFNVEAQRSS